MSDRVAFYLSLLEFHSYDFPFFEIRELDHAKACEFGVNSIADLSPADNSVAFVHMHHLQSLNPSSLVLSNSVFGLDVKHPASCGMTRNRVGFRIFNILIDVLSTFDSKNGRLTHRKWYGAHAFGFCQSRTRYRR